MENLKLFRVLFAIYAAAFVTIVIIAAIGLILNQ